MTRGGYVTREHYGRFYSVVMREGRAYSCGHRHTTRELAEKCGRKRIGLT